MTLAHSRHAFLYPVLAEDSAAWLAGHIEAFAFFGAVPRRIVPDNLTAGILKPFSADRKLAEEKRCELDCLYQRISNDLDAIRALSVSKRQHDPLKREQNLHCGTHNGN